MPVVEETAIYSLNTTILMIIHLSDERLGYSTLLLPQSVEIIFPHATPAAFVKE